MMHRIPCMCKSCKRVYEYTFLVAYLVFALVCFFLYFAT